MKLNRAMYAALVGIVLLSTRSCGYTNDEAWQLYLDVCRYGSKTEMEQFFNMYSIDVNTKDPESNRSGIELAANCNFHPDAVQYLIDRGANSATLDEALLLAIEFNCTEVVRLLEKAGAKLGRKETLKYGNAVEFISNNKTKLTTEDLITAINNSSAEVIKQMLVQGVAAREDEDYGIWSPISYFLGRVGKATWPGSGWDNDEPDDKTAAIKVQDQEEIIELLLWRGGNPNTRCWEDFGRAGGSEKDYPLAMVQILPNLRMFEAFLKAGATAKISKSELKEYANSATLWKKYSYYSKLTKEQRRTVRKKFFKEMEDRYLNVAAQPAESRPLEAQSPSAKLDFNKAVVFGSGAEVERLSAGVTLSNSSLIYYLFCAARNNSDPSVIDALCRAKTESTRSFVNDNALDDYNPLWPAAQWNTNPEMIKVLLYNGLDLSARNTQGLTPLQLAAKYNRNPAVAEFLFSKRPESLLMLADLIKENEFMSKEDREALTLKLIRMKYKELTEDDFVNLCCTGPEGDVKLILRSGLFNANITAADGRTPLTAAAEKGETDIISLLLAAGAEPNKANAEGIFPLMAAARSGNSSAVRALLHAGANVNTRTRGGVTPLMYIVAYCTEPAMVNLFLNAGSRLEEKDAQGWTPLCWAVANGDAKMITGLLTAGADVNVKPGGQNLVSLFQRNNYLSDDVKYMLSKDIRMMQR